MTDAPAIQAPTDGVTPESGQAADTGQGSNPFASFEGDALGYIQNKGWDKEGGITKLVDSYKSLESMRGVPEDRLLKLPEGEDGWDEVYKRLGKPDEVKGYDYNAPEGQEIDQGRMDWFNKLAHDLHLNKTQHNKLAEATQAYETEIFKGMEDKAGDERTIELNKLKDEWGNAYEERIELGSRAMRAFADKDTMNKLEDAMGSNSAVIRLFAKIGESISEHKLPAADGDRQFGQTPEMIADDIQTLKDEIKADPARLANFNKNIGADIEKLARLRKLANG